jgi:cell division septum initiation protein DivIVA
MYENNVNKTISELYDMIQNAKNVLLSSEKCIIERDAALDMLDAIIAELPDELKAAKTIVDGRNELLDQARREADKCVESARQEAANILTRANSEASDMVAKAKEEVRRLAQKETIYAEAQRQAKEMVDQANDKIEDLKKLSNQFISDTLKQTEESVEASLRGIKETRAKFTLMVGEKTPAEKRVESLDISID